MKVSIRTTYRIVKVVGDKETVFVPQYQEEGDPLTTFHNFRTALNGRTGGYNDICFSNLEDAIMCVETNRA